MQLKRNSGKAVFRTWWVATALLPLLVLLHACRPSNKRGEGDLDTFAKSYLRLAVALGEHDADSIDYFYGDPEWIGDVRHELPSLKQIHSATAALGKALEQMESNGPEELERRRFLTAQVGALACRSALLSGTRMSFDDELRCSFGVSLSPVVSEAELKQTRSNLEALLPGSGQLNDRYARFSMEFTIPPARLRTVMERAIRECREYTLQHAHLPSDESIALIFVHDKPWSAYSLYQGKHHSIVSVNMDYPLTIDRALDLACHESYPGHHFFNLTQDSQRVRALGEIERTIQLTYTPQSLLSESAATMAGSIAFSERERYQFERQVLAPLAGVRTAHLARYLEVETLVDRLHPTIPRIARDYLDGSLEFARASTELENQALMSNTFESLKYFNEFRSYIVTYTFGPDLLAASLPACTLHDAERLRWETYLSWIDAPPPALTGHSGAQWNDRFFVPTSTHQEFARCTQ